MQISLWRRLFGWEYRIGRVEFLIRFLAAHVLALFCAYLLFPLNADLAKLVTVVVGALIYFNAAVLRSHDLNRSGYFSIWLIVPIAFVVVFFMLLFQPGQVDSNKFGHRPRLSSESWFGRIALWRRIALGLAALAFFIGTLVVGYLTRNESRVEFEAFAFPIFFSAFFYSLPLVLLALLPTFWGWLLARISEISRAIRGRN